MINLENSEFDCIGLGGQSLSFISGS